MRKGLLAFIALAVVAAAGIGFWMTGSHNAENVATSNASPEPVSEAQPDTPTPVDLSNPVPEIHVTSTTNAPAPVVVNEPAIRGRVIDEYDMPIADAAVTVYHADTGPYRVFTDYSGNFAIGDLVADRPYRLSVIKANYNEAVNDEVVAASDGLTLILTATSSAIGRVVDEAGRPISRFDVVYLKQVIEDDSLWKEIVRSGATVWQKFDDAQGRYEISGVASEAPFSLGAQAEGYEAAVIAVAAVAPAERAAPADIVLKSGARIAGLVLSPKRAPVSGAHIHLGPDTDGPIVGRTDAAGTFVLSGMSDLPIELTAAHEAYLPATVRVSPRRGHETLVELVFGQGGTLVGRVTRGHRPAPGQTITASRLTEPRILKRVVTDEDGRYRIDGLGTGLLDVFSRHALPGDGATLRIQSQINIVAGAETTLNFDFPDTLGTLEGSITVNGSPASFAEIQGTIDTDQGRATFTTTARDDGFYRVENMVSGSAWINVTARSNDAELRRNLAAELRPGEVTQLNVDFDEAATLSGEVTNIANDEVGQVLALAGREPVDVSTVEAILLLESIRAGESDIDENGQFAISGLEPGVYTLVALVFRAEAGTGDDAINSIRVATATTTLPESGSVSVTLALSP